MLFSLLISKKCIDFFHVQRCFNPMHLSTSPLIPSTSGGLESQVSSRWWTWSAMHAILLRIEELKKQVRFVRIFFRNICDEHGSKCAIGFLLSLC